MAVILKVLQIWSRLPSHRAYQHQGWACAHALSVSTLVSVLTHVSTGIIFELVKVLLDVNSTSPAHLIQPESTIIEQAVLTTALSAAVTCTRHIYTLYAM